MKDFNDSKGINYLFNETSLYAKEFFDVFYLDENEKYNYNKEEFLKFLRYLGIGEERLVTRCHLCKEKFPFSYTRNLFEFNKDTTTGEYYMDVTNHKFPSPFPIYIDLNNGGINVSKQFNKENLIENKIWYIHYYFTCTKSNAHKYMMMVSIELKEGRFIVTKIGQNPSMQTVKGFDFDKHKKILSDYGAYEDYKKADISSADHFYVGAYAYLRRVFEKMLDNYLDGAKLPDKHVETKIKAVKEKFDPRVRERLNNLYDILSIGIHELPEEQSEGYYEHLKAVIDMQLTYVQTEKEKEEQSKKLEKTFGKIVNEINNS